MNKLAGFYELKNISLPTIPWQEYKPDIKLSTDLLWTIRSAVNHGDDVSLPRLVGKSAEEAEEFANELYKKLNGKGLVVFYPYFIVHKSGTLNVCLDKVIIEAVKDDLWNLVTDQNIDTSLTFDKDNNIISSYGNPDFLNDNEIKQLLLNAKKVFNIYRDDIIDGNSILLEWSFASSCNKEKEAVGTPYLVFYEVRTVK